MLPCKGVQVTLRPGYRPSFCEDLPRPDKDERLVDDVPNFIAELVADYSKWVAPRFEFEDQIRFLRSLPQTYTYHGYPMQDDLCFLLTRCMSGVFAALDEYRENPKIPTQMKLRARQGVGRIQAAARQIPQI